MKLEFKAEVTDVEIWYLDNYIKHLVGLEYEIYNTFALVKYSATLNVWPWGINGIDINISEINFTFDVAVEKEFLTEKQISALLAHGFTEVGNFLKFSENLIISDGIKFSKDILKNGVLSISEIEIEFNEDGTSAKAKVN